MLRKISCVAMAAVCSMVSASESKAQSVLVDYAPTTEAGVAFDFFTMTAVGVLADGPYTTGGTLVADDATAGGGLSIFGFADSVVLGSFDAEQRIAFRVRLDCNS